MLLEHEQAELLAKMAQTAEAMGYALSDMAAAMMADDLSVFPLEDLDRALKRVRSMGAGKLTLKVILDQLEALVGRVSANEAWALALASFDEAETVIWSNETVEALEQARPLLLVGDKVGARMAFIAAYERIVAQAREHRQLPQVQVSFGQNRELRQLALVKAVERQQLPAPMAVVLALENGVTLPAEVFNTKTLGQAVALGYIKPEEAQSAIAHGRLELSAPAINVVALLAGNVEPSKGATPEIREKLNQLRDAAARRVNRFTRAQVLARAKRMELGRAKRKAAAAVLAYQQGGA